MLGLLVCGRVPSDATKNFSFTAARCLFSFLNLWLEYFTPAVILLILLILLILHLSLRLSAAA